MRALAFALLVAAGTAAAVALVLQRRDYSWEIAASTRPDGNRIAFVRGESCGPGPCQSLWIGASRETATRVAALGAGSEPCDEIAWTPDGKRVGFLIDRRQLHVYDAETMTPAGIVPLVEPGGRIARGVTFSENGAAVTFDDCPRTRAGCRAGLAGVPRQGTSTVQ